MKTAGISDQNGSNWSKTHALIRSNLDSPESFSGRTVTGLPEALGKLFRPAHTRSLRRSQNASISPCKITVCKTESEH